MCLAVRERKECCCGSGCKFPPARTLVIIIGADMSRTVVCCCYFGVVLVWILGVFSSTGLCGAVPRGGGGVGRSYLSEDDDDDGYTTHNDPMDRLSKLFGIKKIPPDFRHKTPPEYMTSLYKSVAYDDGITKSAAPYDADVVRGFPDRGTYSKIYLILKLREEI